MLDIKQINKGMKLPRTTIEYEPGPIVDITSVYRLYFYIDLKISEIK